MSDVLAQHAEAALPTFYPQPETRHFIDVFNQGTSDARWSVSTSEDWIDVSQTQGESDARLWVSVDWSKAPHGRTVSGAIHIDSAASRWVVQLNAMNPEGLDVATLPEAVERHNGVMISAVDYTSREDGASGTGWRRVDQAIATGDGMTIQPVTAPSINPRDIESFSPALSYDFYAFNTGA